ncbi:hypothetical protein PDESU_01309 [Pontiella desulfatans]|uniref:Uncharacterized protein n=2 Tax=Pontiella desulfatans TaxID=2750659 RepID=A0A6C2TYS7_PONDE|nr:hypothetical protein PDESU_01309 [Pontiella desulfatans]
MPLPSSACLSDPGYYVWGASMVRDAQGLCHLLYSRWKKEFGFNAWVTHSGIAHAVSADPLGPYTHVDMALPVRGAGFWDGACTHNPSVLFHEGKYYLYYMGNTGDGKPAGSETSYNWTHRNRQRIGVAVADSPAGPWNRRDEPLVDVGAGSLMVSNPAVVARPDGGFLMIYKEVGTREPLPFGGPVVHRVALGEQPVGPFSTRPEPVFTSGTDGFPAEDPFVWVQGRKYRAILKDMEGRFSGVERALVLFESDDGLDWRVAEPCLVSDRTVKLADGTSRRYDYLERPQLHLEDGMPRILFCAARDGDETFNVHIPLIRECF